MRVHLFVAFITISAIFAACTKPNPRYCVKDVDCGPGGACDVVARECRVGAGGAGGSAGGADGSTGGSQGGGAGGGGAGAGGGGGRPADGGTPDRPAPDALPGCNGDDDCARTDPAHPVCENRVCVGCAGPAQCMADRPICGTARRCAACTGDAECKALGDPARVACDTASGRCVPCVSSSTCPADKPICGANRQCAGCTSDMQCKGLGQAGRAVCDTAAGRCVECLNSGQCGNAGAPICDTQAKTCGPCVADAQCAAKAPNPGVCMEGGRCATEAEAVFVENKAGCSPAGGTAAMPVCALADAAGKLTAGRLLVVVRGGVDGRFSVPSTPGKVVIVGQKSGSGDVASVAAGAGTAIQVGGGEVLVRDLAVAGGNNSMAAAVDVGGSGAKLTLLRTRISGATGLGIRASGGAHLTMDKCILENNAGGGVLVDAAGYTITNSVIAGSASAVQFTTNIPAGSRFASNTVLGGVACVPSSVQTIVGSVTSGANFSCTLDRTVTSMPDFDPARPYRLKARLPCPGGDPATYPPDDIDGQSRKPPIDCGADQYAP